MPPTFVAALPRRFKWSGRLTHVPVTHQRLPLPLQRRNLSSSTTSPGGSARVVATASTSGAVTTLRLASPPVNILDLATLGSLRASLESARTARTAVVLTGSDTIFSAGLDIKEMHLPQRDRFHRYFAEVQSLFFELFLHPSPVVAAISGPAPAGGTWLACCAFYRVCSSSSKAVLGLNETLIGVVAPSYVAEPFMRLVGRGVGEQLLTRGVLLPPSESLRLGLVDEVVAPEEVVTRAQIVAAELAAIPYAAR